MADSKRIREGYEFDLHSCGLSLDLYRNGQVHPFHLSSFISSFSLMSTNVRQGVGNITTTHCATISTSDPVSSVTSP